VLDVEVAGRYKYLQANITIECRVVRTVPYPFGLPGFWGWMIVPDINGFNALL
jgi:hypothetical protein